MKIYVIQDRVNQLFWAGNGGCSRWRADLKYAKFYTSVGGAQRQVGKLNLILKRMKWVGPVHGYAVWSLEISPRTLEPVLPAL